MKNQKGFSVITALLILVIIGIIGSVGWYVYSFDKYGDESLNNANKSSSSTVTKKQRTIEKTPAYEIPNGFTKYENKELGFRFSYPSSWGTLSPKAGSVMILELQTPALAFSGSDEVQLTVWTDRTLKFKTYANYKQPAYTPVLSADDYIWKYAEPAYGYEQGAIADLGEVKEPKTSNVQVYGIKGGHACEGNQQWLFPVKDTFVGLNITYGNCYVMDDNISTEKKAEADAFYTKLISDVKMIPATIEID